ncbi:unnamed protein product [Caenorhabditis angaria]|uniref:Uncharacterized protein n=1 Tax=Caenorhabditis angaria TaxID=860376 RepID=A0A9P1J2J1_9PELO|nr:unnamed protein product [Caenorhabditis angaria]
MMSARDPQLKQCEALTTNLLEILKTKMETPDWNRFEPVAMNYTYVLFERFNEHIDISIDRKRELIAKLIDWLKISLDTPFYESRIVLNCRNEAKEDCVEDIRKMRVQQKEEIIAAKPVKRKKGKRKAVRKISRAIDTSSSDEQVNVQRQRQMLELAVKHRLNFMSSSESVEREISELEIELDGASTILQKWSKRDKVILIVKLFCKLSHILSVNEFVKYIAEILGFLPISEKCEEHRQLQYSNLVILFAELSLEVFKIIRWRNQYSEECVDVMNQMWALHTLVVIIFSQVDENVMTDSTIYSHYETCLNLLQALLFEYFYIISTNCYEVEPDFVQNFFNFENFYWFNLPTMSNDIIRLANVLQTCIEIPKPIFYRTMFMFLVVHFRQLQNTILTKFLLTSQPGFQKVISVAELCYITKNVTIQELVEILGHHAGDCDFMFSTLNHDIIDTSADMIKLSSRIVDKLSNCHHELRVNFQLWSILIRQLGKCYHNLIVTCKDKPNFEISNKVFFDFMFTALKNLLKESCSQMRFAKYIVFLLKQISKILLLIKPNEFLPILRLIEEYRIVLASSEYNEKVAEFISYCFQFSQKHEDANLKLDISRLVMLMAYDIFATQHPRIRKLQHIRYYCRIIFDFFVSEMESAAINKNESNENIFPPDYFMMVSQSRNFINMYCSIKAQVEKDLFEAKALCVPYHLLNVHLILPLAKNSFEEDSAKTFEKALLEIVQTVILTPARNTVIHCLMTVIERVVQVKNSKFENDQKIKVCDEIFHAVHNVVMNYNLDSSIFSLPQANDLKKLMFQSSQIFLSLSVFDKSIIDYLADTNGDFNWITNDLKNLCEPGQIIPFLIFKYNNAPANSLAKRRFLDVLSHCASYYQVPTYFRDSLREPNVIEHGANLIEGVSISTWFNLPKPPNCNTFVFLLGCTFRVTFNSDRKSFSISFAQNQSSLVSKTIQHCFINPFKWHLLTISLKASMDGVLVITLSIDEHCEKLEFDENNLPNKKLFRSVKNTIIRWDLTDIFHTPVIIRNGVLNYQHVAAIMAMGPQSRQNIGSANIQNIPILRFNRLRIANNDEKLINIFDENILQDVQTLESHVIDKFCHERVQRMNFHQQFVAAGGIPALLLLYGRALIDCCDVSIQNYLIRLILTLMSKPHVDSERWPISPAKSVLAFLFKSDLTIFNDETLEILILHCFEIPMNMKQEDSEPFKRNNLKMENFEMLLLRLTKSYVKDVEILENLVKDWDLWVYRPLLFTKLIKCLASSVSTYNSYNINNLHPLVKHIMKTLTTIFEQKPDWGVRGDELACEVGKFCGIIVKSLSGQSKIECAHELWNCLLLLKPASDMYVENDQVTHHQWFNEDAIDHELRILSDIKLPSSSEKPKIIVTENMEKYVQDDSDDDSDEDDSGSEVFSENEHIDGREDELMEIAEEDDRVPSPAPSVQSDFIPIFEKISNSQHFIKRSWDVLLQKEIYDILIELVMLSPDDERIGNDSLCEELLIVFLTKQNDNWIISRIMKLFAALMNYCTSLEDQFLICKSEQFKILAAQLRGRPLDLSVSNSLFSILFQEEVDISAGLDSAHVMRFEPNLISCHVLDAILVAFEESLHVDDAGEMFIHTCAALSIIYENNSQLALALIDRKIEEVMVNVMYQLCIYPTLENTKDTVHMKKTSWMSFAKKLVNISITTSSQKYYQCSEKLVKLIILSHVQEKSDGNENPNKVVQENIYHVLCTLLFELLQSLLGTADVDSQNHRSASASNTPCGTNGPNTPEDLDYVYIHESTHKWTDGLVKFKDKLRQKFQGFSPNLKCPYPKKTLQPLSPFEMTTRVKRVFTICNMFYTICRPPGFCSDEDVSLHHVYFHTLARIALDDSLITTTPWFLSIQPDARMHFAGFIASVLFDYPRKMGRTENQLFYHVDVRKMKILNKLMQSTPISKIKSILSMNVNFEACIQTGLLEDVFSRHSDDVFLEMCLQFLKMFDFQYYEYAKNAETLDADTIQLLSSEYDMVAQCCNEDRKVAIRELLHPCLIWKLQQQSEEYKLTVNELTQHAVMMQGDARKIGYTRLSRHFKGEAMAKTEFVKYKDVLGHIGRRPKTINEYPPMKVSAVQGPRGERIRFDDTTNVLPEKFHSVPIDRNRPLATLWDSIQMIHANRSVKESSLFTCDSTLVLNGSYYDGVLVLTDVNLYFLPNNESQKNMHIEISFTTILTLHYRRFELKNLAFELFMDNHSTWFFAIRLPEDRRLAITLITDRSKCKIAEPSDILQYSKDWENGKITNFEYLMILNAYAGRTYHDFMQYPIMPHIISNLDTDEIDLNDSESYRNLAKPIAVQRESMEERYRNCYDMLAESMSNDTHSAPYHYASLYSNLATVSYYLVRLLPHAKIAIDFQDGSFDVPDRIFHDFSSTFRLAAGGSATDYKELVPEMFTTPEVFLNVNNMNFGTCQNGEVVNDVVLPKWCFATISDNEFLGDEQNMRRFKADLFIIAQRHALESQQVQKRLNEWIDLIFGYKQTGLAARQALNIYHPAVYPESIPPDHTDSILYAAHKANVRNIGQAPIQLFTKPHVARHIEQSSDDEFIIGGIKGLGIGNQIYHHPLELKEIDVAEEVKVNKIKNMFSERSTSDKVLHSSTFFPTRNDFKNITVTFDDYTITISDVKLKQSITKRMSGKIQTVQHYSDSQYIASMGVNGVIDFYKILQKNFFGEFTLGVVYDGAIHATYGTFRDLDVCQSFNGVFTVSNPMLAKQYISVWDLYEKRLIRCTEIDAERLEIFGVLKHSGELFVADKSTYLEDIKRSMICKFSINGRLMMKQTYDYGFIDGALSQIKPGEGIPMLANTCTDLYIRIFETITLTCVRCIDFSKSIKNPPHRIEYESDGNIVIFDDHKNKWKFVRKTN